MDDHSTLRHIRQLVVETAESLHELRKAAGRTESSPAEVEQAAYFGALHTGITSNDLNERLLAVLTEMLEELVATKAAPLLVERD